MKGCHLVGYSEPGLLASLKNEFEKFIVVRLWCIASQNAYLEDAIINLYMSAPLFVRKVSSTALCHLLFECLPPPTC